MRETERETHLRGSWPKLRDHFLRNHRARRPTSASTALVFEIRPEERGYSVPGTMFSPPMSPLRHGWTARPSASLTPVDAGVRPRRPLGGTSRCSELHREPNVRTLPHLRAHRQDEVSVCVQG